MANKKSIIITGGGLSSLGKGIIASSLGALLASAKVSVALQKFDPYLNIDPGTMNPGEHGEVFVTDDGAETDLDLGNYERFLNKSLDRRSSVTSGMIFQAVLDAERKGDFLGQTVQVIPHVTGEICKRFQALHEDNQVVITEFGGTIGDIEGAALLEAARIFKAESGVDVIHVHVAFVPYLTTTHEFKSKIAQGSIRDCMSLGLPPDIVVCRSEQPIHDRAREKVALASGLSQERVFDEWNVDDIYEVPLILNDQNMGQVVLDLLDLPGEINVKEWENYRMASLSPRKTVKVAVCGKYVDAPDAYKSVIEAVRHAGNKVGVRPEIELFDVEAHGNKALLNYDAVIIPGGFGERGWGDKISVAKQCYDNDIPLLGICFGMQAMVISYARNVKNIAKANSTEVRKDCVPIIDLMEDQKGKDNKGGTLRLGAQTALLKEDSQVSKMYGTNESSERHRHRYELKSSWVDKLEGLVFSGVSPNGKLVEYIEHPEKRFYVGCQGHPELKSRPHTGHPLFIGLLESAIE